MSNVANIGPYQISSHDDELSLDDVLTASGKAAQWDQLNSYVEACDSSLALKMKSAFAGKSRLRISELSSASQTLQCGNANRNSAIQYVMEHSSEIASINSKFKAALDILSTHGLNATPPDHAIRYRVHLGHVLLALDSLTIEEQNVVHYILNFNPKILGINIPKTSGSVPFLSNNRVVFAEITTNKDIPLLPAQKDAFERMASACQKATGEILYPVEGYRSQGYQLTKFIEHLVKNKFDIVATSRRVAFPGYSEHESTTNPAMDINVKNHNGDFVDTKSYLWMQENAHKYGFIQSYTDTNSINLGVMPEPWHWTLTTPED